ncbi:MAG TPA: hypothetical protein VLQ93_05600, partial [Myxococcaceae bacterium]|nr:hypothetical protein [Myxococcaceae bacterium]
MGPQTVPMQKPRRAARARWLLAALLVGALAGCKQDETSSTPAPSGTSSEATPSSGGESTPGAASSSALSPPTPESLTPVIRELGPEGQVPREVVLEFPRPVMPSDGEVPKGTVLEVTPEVPGRLSFRGPSTLVFTPRKGFALQTKYTVTLASLELDEDTVLKPPSADAWRRTFTTPAFAFLRLSPRQMDVKKGRVEADLVFSGPVDAASVRRFISFSVDGQPLSVTQLRTSPSDRHVLTAALGGSGLRPGATVRFALRPGLSAADQGELTAPKAEAGFELKVGRRIEITHAFTQEGATGHYIEVRCHEVDGASEGSEARYRHWSRRERCGLEDEVAADVIHLEPPVKFSVSPSREGFRIFGDFKRGTYALRIDAGATSPTGGTLLSTFERSFSVSARSPQLRFATTGRYLPRSAWRNLPLSHLNLDSVELVVRHVPPENLVFWMSNDYGERADERTSNVLVRKTLPLRGAEDTLTTTYVDVGSLVPASTRGLVELTAGGRGQVAASRILLTDLSLVAKRGAAPRGSTEGEEVRVWALGMESTEPLSGVEVSLVKKSGQTVARCTTSGAEGCRLAVPAPGVDTAEPFAL